MAPERDQTWAAMVEVADRMTDRYCKGDTLKVYASRRLRPFHIVEGLQVADNWTDVFEPVRTRRWFSQRWIENQPVQEAAANVGIFLRERPDKA